MGLHAITRQRFLAAAFLAVFAVACGGGGSDGGGTPAPAPSPAPAPAPGAQPVSWGAFPSAVAVIGHAGFEDGSAPVGPSPTTLNFPVGSPALGADGTLFVAAQGELQVKAFRNYLAGNGPAAAFSFSVNNGLPAGVSIHGQQLLVLEDDFGAIYDPVLDAPPTGQPFASIGAAPGCSESQLNRPTAAFITPLGQVLVADSNNHRVLIWSSVGDGGPVGPAQVVLGQKTKLTCEPNDHDGDGDGDSTPIAETLNQPTAVWSDGVKVVVADRGNNRVLIWDSFPTTDFAGPSHVLGQADYISHHPNAGLDAPTASTLSRPMSVDVSESGQLAVADRDNHRILVWNAFPSSRTAPANQVIGQADLLTSTSHPASIKTLKEPSGVRFDGRNMIVTDTGNHRVLVFRALD